MESPKDILKKENKYAGLRKCFTAIVDRKQVNLDLSVIELLLKNELNIGSVVNNETLTAILPYMFIFYIKSWPGWQRSKEHYSGKLSFKDWFERFRQFIVVKMNFLIKNGYDQAIKLIEEDKRKAKGSNDMTKNVNQALQVDLNGGTSMAPYSINITCPPNLMTSLLFSQSGDNIILTRHTALDWKDLSYKQLLNWPFVSVEFVSPHLHFKRKNSGEFHRYLNLSNHVSLPAQEYVESIYLVDAVKPRVCYSSKLIAAYAAQYIKVFSNIMSISSENMATLFGELIQDIKDIPANNTIATNSVVLFNIGRGYFFRKKMSSEKGKESNNCVKLNEIYIPKMELTFFDFKDVQELNTTPDINFKGLNAVKPTEKTWSGVLKYRCEYCELPFETHEAIEKHLCNEHGREGNFRCFKCDKELTVPQLSEVRWQHMCFV